MAALGDLVVNLTANTTNFQRGMSNAQQTLNRMAAAAAAMGAVAVSRLASTGDMFDKMSIRTGIAVDELSRFKFAAEQSGSGIGAIETGLKRMSALMLNAERGLATATDTLDELGVSINDLAGRSQSERFAIFAEAIAGIEDPAMRTAQAMQVFGRSGTDLMPLLLEGADGFAKLAKESDELGNTVTKTQAKLGADLTDAFNRAKVAGDGLFRTIGEQLAPSVIKLSNGFAKVLAFAQDYGRAIAVLGTALITAAAAMKALSIATKAYAKAAAVAQAMSGPKGLASLAVGLAAAAGAALAVDHALAGINKEAEQFERWPVQMADDMKKAEDAVNSLAHSVAGVEDAKSKNSRPKFAGAMQRGSSEAVTAVVKATMKDRMSKEEKLLKELQKITKAVKESSEKRQGQGVVVAIQEGV